MDLKENQKRFNEALNTIMPFEKYFWIIYYCFQYAVDGKQPYTVGHIINNTFNTVLAISLYPEHIKMCHEKISSDKTRADFKKFFAEEYHDLQKLQHINTTQAVFHGYNMAITMQ